MRPRKKILLIDADGRSNQPSSGGFMSIFFVEKNVPVPAFKNKGARPPLYPFAEMEVGDSFFVPIVADSTLRLLQARVANAATWSNRRGHTSGRKFTVRQMVGGVRCWRIA